MKTPTRPAAPEHLSPAARLAWGEITTGMNRIDGVEATALEAYAVAIARLRDARKRIDAEGLIVADPKGAPIPHPALVIEKAAAAEVRAWLTRYRPFVSTT